MAPEWTKSMAARRLGSWRNWNPDWKIPLAERAASTMTRTSSGVFDIGFSQ